MQEKHKVNYTISNDRGRILPREEAVAPTSGIHRARKLEAQFIDT